MPPRKSSRNTRPRRPIRREAPIPGEQPVVAPVGTATAATTAARAGRVSTRTRSRQPGQIVIANYDFLRHDIRILGVLAPSLVIVLVLLSIFVK